MLLGMAKAYLVLVLMVSAAILLAASETAHAAQSISTGASYTTAVDRQTEGEPPASDDDSTVWVQTYTVLAAGGAAAFFLLLFLGRIALGRGPVAPEPQEDPAHH